jgi:hypothetical protein
MNEWPFADPRNVATFTVRQIMDAEHPILLVCHDEDDGGWQFLTGRELRMEDALLVSLAEVVKLDPSVTDLADLPVGWKARREHAGAAWIRELA